MAYSCACAPIRIPDPIPEDWRDLMEAIFDEYGGSLVCSSRTQGTFASHFALEW